MKAKKGTILIHVMEDRIRLSTVRSSIWRSELSGYSDIMVDIRKEGQNRDFSNKLFKELETFSLQRNIKNPRIIVALSRGLLNWRYFSIPPVARENLDNLINFEMEKHVPVKKEELYYHYLPVEQSSEAWTIMLVGTRRDFLHGIEEALKMIGYKPDVIIPDIWGLVYILRKRGHHPEEDSSVIVNLESNEVELTVFVNGLPRFYRLYKLPEWKSEDSGTISQSEGVVQRAGEAARLIDEALIEAGKDLSLSDKVVRGFLCSENGNGDLVLQKIATEAVGVWHVTKTSELANIKGEIGRKRPRRLQQLAGLAAGANKARSCPVNLLPVPIGRKPEKVNYRMTAALLMILAAAAAFLSGSMYYERQRRLDRLEDQISKLKGRVEQVKVLSTSLEREQSRIKTLEDTLTERTMVTNILKELTERIPASAYLNQITMRKNSLELSGFADSASELISALEASRLFKNVSFVAPITSLGQQKERFKIKLSLE